MDCGIHAREWVSPAFCLYVLDRLLDRGSQSLLNRFDFYVMPVANPDGYVYTWAGNRMWRKNRRPSSMLLFRSNERQFWFPGVSQGGNNFGPLAGFPGNNVPGFPGAANSNSKCWGTDPNRNFDIGHGTVGSSNNPCQDTYHGERPFSEAESKAVRDGLQTVVSQHGGSKHVTYVSVHAYSQLWMFPNGHLKSLSKYHTDLKRVANVAANSLRYSNFVDKSSRGTSALKSFDNPPISND